MSAVFCSLPRAVSDMHGEFLQGVVVGTAWTMFTLDGVAVDGRFGSRAGARALARMRGAPNGVDGFPDRTSSSGALACLLAVYRILPVAVCLIAAAAAEWYTHALPRNTRFSRAAG